MKLIFSGFLLFLISCAGTETNIDSENLEQIYHSNGVEQYFLSPLPYWANFSSEGKCFRKFPVRFLNFETIKKNYNLGYEQMIHLQNMFNRKILAYKSSTNQNVLTPKDESFIFYNVYQKVLGGSYDFQSPKFDKVSVVWIDPILKNPRKIKTWFSRGDILSGYPIILSHCLSSAELETLAQELEIDNLGVKYISSDMLSVFSSGEEKNTYFSLDISEILKNKTIQFFSTKKSKEVKGKFQFRKLQ